MTIEEMMRLRDEDQNFKKIVISGFFDNTIKYICYHFKSSKKCRRNLYNGNLCMSLPISET